MIALFKGILALGSGANLTLRLAGFEQRIADLEARRRA